MKPARKPEPTETQRREPRSLTLLEVLRAVQAVAETDAEAAATLDFMLRSGRVRFVDGEALAA